jgi:release factor glutamine methyltransferase
MLIDQLGGLELPRNPVGLDLCTGSGVLAIAAAQICGARMTAVDVSRRAVVAVRLNAALNRADVHPVRGDLFEPVRGRRFDLIVSNPPYVPTPDGCIPERGLARAWEGGHDGRTFLDRICGRAAEHLNPGGSILLVHSSVCGERETLEQLSQQGLATEVMFRHRGELGPILRARQEWLHGQGLLTDDGGEDMLVIRGTAPAAETGGAADALHRRPMPAVPAS